MFTSYTCWDVCETILYNYNYKPAGAVNTCVLRGSHKTHKHRRQAKRKVLQYLQNVLIQKHVTRLLHKHQYSGQNKAALRPEFHYMAAVRPTDASKEEKIRQTDKPAQQFGAE